MRYSTEEKARWLEQWRNSGKSTWAYAKENGLCRQTFFNWTKQKIENNAYFVEVPAGGRQFLRNVFIDRNSQSERTNSV